MRGVRVFASVFAFGFASFFHGAHNAQKVLVQLAGYFSRWCTKIDRCTLSAFFRHAQKFSVQLSLRKNIDPPRLNTTVALTLSHALPSTSESIPSQHNAPAPSPYSH